MHVHASKYVFDNACGNVYMYLCVLMFVCVYICNYVNVQFVCFLFICLLIFSFCLFLVYFTNHYLLIVCIKGKRI